MIFDCRVFLFSKAGLARSFWFYLQWQSERPFLPEIGVFYLYFLLHYFATLFDDLRSTKTKSKLPTLRVYSSASRNCISGRNFWPGILACFSGRNFWLDFFRPEFQARIPGRNSRPKFQARKFHAKIS